MGKYKTDWYRKLKERLVTMFGGKCQCCGYNRYYGALEFHHIDPTQKDVSINLCHNWEILLKEVQKCVMVCSTCHKEIHAGLRECPEQIPLIDSGYRKYCSLMKEKEIRNCLVCDLEFEVTRISRKKLCSKICARKHSEVIVWPEDSELVEMIRNSNCYAVSKKLKVSDNAIRKRMRKRNLTVDD